MPKKTGTIHIKWIRSGIGFTRKQKEIVRSIGLHRLNQVVERPDTAPFRGLVAKVSHLVEVVDPPGGATWTEVSEYKIVPAETKVAAPSPRKAARKTPAEAPAVEEAKAVAPEKKAPAEKRHAAKPSAKGSEKPKPKQKAAAPKHTAKTKKESKSKKGKK